MDKLLVRHGLSQANNRENFGTPLFGHPDAELMELGWDHAREAGRVLVNRYNSNPAIERVATSRMKRTQQTAEGAGYLPENMTAYPLLDELTMHVTYEQLGESIRDEKPPPIAIDKVEELLSNPPEEQIWFTHGFVIATICYIRGIPYTTFIPKFGEVRELSI